MMGGNKVDNSEVMYEKSTTYGPAGLSLVRKIQNIPI